MGKFRKNAMRPVPGADKPRKMGKTHGVFFFLVLALFLGGMLFVFLEMRSVQHQDPERAVEQMKYLINRVFAVNAAITCILGGWVFVLAKRTFSAKVFPPPGAWVFRDMEIKTGKQAVFRGYLLVLCGMLVLSTNFIFVFLLLLMRSLG